MPEEGMPSDFNESFGSAFCKRPQARRQPSGQDDGRHEFPGSIHDNLVVGNNVGTREVEAKPDFSEPLLPHGMTQLFLVVSIKH